MFFFGQLNSWNDGLAVKVSASQPRDHRFEPYSGHNHVSWYDISTEWLQKAEFDMINISCKNLLSNWGKISMF
jgi:hypothetical protein